MTNSSPYVEMFGEEGARTGPQDRPSMFPNYRTVPFGTQARTRAMTILKNRYADEVRELYLAELAYLQAKADLGSGG